MFRLGSPNFDKLLEKATSNLLLEPDWDSILSICDNIRSGDVSAKYAVAAVKKKFYVENPHVVLYALLVMESCVKNCGSLVHDEVCTRTFMEELRELIRHSTDENVKQKILEMLQTWGMAFRNQSKYRIVTDTLNVMKAEGWKFPPIREAEAMFEADTAPEWAEGDVCHHCRVQFGMMTRQHHCRGCGQVFCSRCSSKACPIPKFGFEKEVRVCDPCFDKFGPKEENPAAAAPRGLPKLGPEHLPPEYLLSHHQALQRPNPPKFGGKTEAEIKEEEDLQLALALSQSEAEEKEKKKVKSPSIAPAVQKQEKPLEQYEDVSPELMRYLNRDYWDQQQRELASKADGNQNQKTPTNGSSNDTPTKSALKKNMTFKTEPEVLYAKNEGPSMLQTRLPGDEELDEFLTTLKTQLEIFVNRMKSNSSRGRPIANDSSVQSLFMNTMAMHSRLLKNIQEQEDSRVYYEGLQDKLAQVKDARAALNALREEEQERRRREAEEAERLRQLQMKEKLEVMRQRKQEYLQYQRQLALQKMQEQERERMMRQEQAKQQYLLQQQAAAVMANHMQHNVHQPMYANPMMQNALPSYQPFVQYPPQPVAQSMGMGHYPPPTNVMPDGSQQLPPTVPLSQPGAAPMAQGAFNLQPFAPVLPSQNYPPVSQAQLGGPPVLIPPGIQQVAPNPRPSMAASDQSELISFD